MLRGSVYLVRHGVTDWNRNGRLQGEAEVPLSREGKSQAKLLGLALRTLEPSRMFCSPLGRALETAKTIREWHSIKSFDIDARLSEIKFGNYSGMTLSEVDEREPGILKARDANRWDFSWPGGESFKDVDQRLRSFALDHLPTASRLITEDVVIIGHETSNAVLMGIQSGLAREEILNLRQPNTIIYRIRGSEIERLDAEKARLGWQPGTLARH